MVERSDKGLKLRAGSHLEEREEDMRLRAGREDEGQEGAEAAVQDGRADVAKGLDGSLVSRALNFEID